MIDHKLEFQLPLPWEGLTFQTDHIGRINFLVGPNGSGKSQFANQLLHQLGGSHNQARLLGTDRLSGMEQLSSLRRLAGDPLSEGFAKNQFSQLKKAGTSGSGIDTIVLLEERLDLRIRIEATLRHLFDREITLEWDSGKLVPKVTRLGGGASYRLDREECHGIKELLVLLSHLYDSRNRYLVIDEPELNLHPQYQAFFMQEVRRVTGDPNQDGKKVVFLVTHSPFILDLQSADDIKSIISFDLDYSPPIQVASLGLDMSSLVRGMLRMNAHHKQLFFSDNPILVEGIHDAWLVEALMEARGVSVASAGSCIIDAGGADEANQYLQLCQGLNKTAHFLYDLDSLFRGTLRRCIRQDESIQSFLASAGLGTDFAGYCGQLEHTLTALIDNLIDSELPTVLVRLQTFLRDLGDRHSWTPDKWAKARIATMTAISRHQSDMIAVVSAQAIEDIVGRRDRILTALRGRNIHVLPGGTLERYLPLYNGDEYDLHPDSKRKSVQAEVAQLANPYTEEELGQRYGDLYEAVCLLPYKTLVDVDPVLRNYLSDYIHELQRTVVNHRDWQAEQIQERLHIRIPSTKNVFSLSEFERDTGDAFHASIIIAGMLGATAKMVRVNERTNAGMGDFMIESHAVA